MQICQTLRHLVDGINQIYYVFGGKLTVAEISAFKLMVEVVLSPEALGNTTLVRTKFRHFDNAAACEQDRSAMLEQNRDTRVR